MARLTDNMSALTLFVDITVEASAKVEEGREAYIQNGSNRDI